MLRENFRDDPMLSQYYVGGRDSDLHIEYLKEKIRSLETARDSFVVAHNCYDLQKAADDLAAKIEHRKNEAFLLRDAIANIDASLRQQPDLNARRVEALYGELRNIFRDDSLRRLREVAEFHEQLLRSRESRLTAEGSRLVSQLSQLEQQLETSHSELDQQLRILGGSKALDQYTAIVNQLSAMNAEVQKLRDYKEIELQYSNKAAALEGEISTETIRANSYLEDTRNARQETFDVFKRFVRRFYPGVEASISLRNNEGDNKLRFDLDVSISNDSSNGINEVRIFCYDLTLLTTRHQHRIQYLFHDSRLFANMDVRQRATLFRLASETATTHGIQYIATLNPDEITGIESEFESSEFQNLIANNIVLELKDDSAAGKLLGIQVDMRYEVKAQRKVA